MGRESVQQLGRDKCLPVYACTLGVERLMAREELRRTAEPFPSAPTRKRLKAFLPSWK
jgi:hypothetical protein